MSIDISDTDTLVHDHGKLVYHLINSIVNDTTVHDDVFQEVFLNVLRSLERFEGRSKISTWIASITVRTCYNYIRSHRKDMANYSFERFLDEGGEIAGTADPDPAEIERLGTASIVKQALDRLPLKYRLPITMFYFEDQSYREIAGALGMPIGSVKTNLYRGLRSMREGLKHERHELL
jgi:RNA polymerase sigma-70 factor (ECF subfamily)